MKLKIHPLLDVDNHNPCRFCSSGSVKTMDELRKALLSCTNCMADMKMKGQWNSSIIASLGSLFKHCPNLPDWKEVCKKMGWPKPPKPRRKP